MRGLLVPLVAAGYAFGLGTASIELVGAPPPPRQPTAIVWADRVFVSKENLTTWLKTRGWSSYEEWAVRNPDGARRVQALPPKASVSTSGDQQLELAAPASTSRDHSMVAMGILIAAVLGLLLLAVTVRSAPYRFRWRARARAPVHRRRRPASTASDRRAQPKQQPPGRRPAPTRAKARRDRPALARVGEPVPKRLWDVAALMQKSRSASHGAWARLEHRRTGRREELGDGRSLDYRRIRLRERLHRNLPDLAMYATCVVLACVVGASIALYLS